MNNKKMNKKGFTIVELVIVIAVIAILAGVMIPTFGGIITKANESKALQLINAAYKEALIEVLADGEIDETTATEGIYTFTFTDGVLTDAKETSDAEYTYTVTEGAITAATKVSN